MYKTGNYELKAYDKVEQIDRTLWESIRDKENLLTDHDYLMAVEASHVLDCDTVYLEFYDKNSLVCTVSGFTLITDFAQYGIEASKRVLYALRGIKSNLFRYKTLEIGSPVKAGLSISTCPYATKQQLMAVAKLLRIYCEDNGISLIMLRDFNKSKSTLEEVMSDANFKIMLNLPIARMKIKWRSFDEYLSDLKLNYRRRIKKNMRKKSENNIQTMMVKGPDSLGQLKDYVKLYQNVRDKSKGIKREFIGEKYHVAMVENLCDYSYWLQYFKKGELVAYSFFIVYQGHLINQYLGLDYDVSLKARLYFNSIYEGIKFAISHNLKSIEAGLTTYESKSAVGYSVLPQRMYVWHKNIIFRSFIAWIFNALTDPKIDNCHYAFKGNKHQYLWDGKEKFCPAAD